MVISFSWQYHAPDTLLSSSAHWTTEAKLNRNLAEPQLASPKASTQVRRLDESTSSPRRGAQGASITVTGMSRLLRPCRVFRTSQPATFLHTSRRKDYEGQRHEVAVNSRFALGHQYCTLLCEPSVRYHGPVVLYTCFPPLRLFFGYHLGEYNYRELKLMLCSWHVLESGLFRLWGSLWGGDGVHQFEVQCCASMDFNVQPSTSPSFRFADR